jgi:hypothetical protein
MVMIIKIRELSVSGINLDVAGVLSATACTSCMKNV